MLFTRLIPEPSPSIPSLVHSPRKSRASPQTCVYIWGCASEQRQHWQNSASTRRHPLVQIRVRVGTSRIAGQGLFAGQEIKQGTKIIRYIGEKITNEESERRLAA